MNARIENVLNTWIRAERAGDADGLGRLLTDDFVGIGPAGFVLPKDAWLARLGPELRYERLDLDEISARTYGNTTLVVAHQRAAGEARGHSLPPDTRVSFVMVGDGAEPRIAGIQYSFMAPPQGAAQ